MLFASLGGMTQPAVVFGLLDLAELSAGNKRAT